jgi:intracellular sulfur oxidation DsrE/DsrF family protein
MKLFLIISCGLLSLSVNGQALTNPVIKNFGGVYDVPFAIEKPDPSINYKIVGEVGTEIPAPEKVFEPLDHLARLYNLHIYGGVPQKNLDVVFVIYQFSTGIVLNNEAYRAKYNVDNPNLQIIDELTKAGVKVIVCGQSLMKQHMDPKAVNPNVKIAVSRFTTVSTYQMKGYAFFKF